LIRLALLLLGPEFIRARWHVLALIGALWAALGVGIFVDALDGDVYFPVHVFGYLLILEALVTLIATTSNLGTQTVLRKSRGALFLIVGLLMVSPYRSASFILALLFGLSIGVDGLLRTSAAWVVRFPGWQASLLMGLLELGFAAFMIEPFPTFYAGTVAYCVGISLFLSGLGTLLLALRLRRLPPGTSLTLLFGRSRVAGPGAQHALLPTDSAVTADAAPLLVRVWTPAGSATDALPQPLIDRYVAAVDANGVISTGHAALEVAPDLYISHYPAQAAKWVEFVGSTACQNLVAAKAVVFPSIPSEAAKVLAVDQANGNRHVPGRHLQLIALRAECVDRDRLAST